MPDALVTPLTTPERLAVLESLNVNLQADVSEIKRDVKELAKAQAALATDFATRSALEARLATELATKTALIATDLATKTASVATNLAVTQSADSATGIARASNGVWIRAVVPWFIAGIGALATVIALVNQ